MNIRNAPNALTLVEMSSDFTGILSCSTNGTPVPFPSVINEGGFYLKAHPDNADTNWIFFTGQTKASGFPMDAGDVVFAPVNQLSQISFDAEVDAEDICWIKA